MNQAQSPRAWRRSGLEASRWKIASSPATMGTVNSALSSPRSTCGHRRPSPARGPTISKCPGRVSRASNTRSMLPGAETSLRAGPGRSSSVTALG